MTNVAQKQELDFPVELIRRDFPILHQQINGHPLAYLDNAATSQKPQCVIDRLLKYYSTDNANIHRGVHSLSQRATDAFEHARHSVQHYINAQSVHEIIFLRGTTEAINLVAQTYGKQNLEPGDEILITEMEHHANIVPWQMICAETRAKLRVIPMNDAGEISLDDVESMLSPRTKLLAMVHISNALGTINPVKQAIEIAHKHGVPVLLDGAQAGAHTVLDVQALNCDFYTLSAHKMLGPTGIGALYVKDKILQTLPPYQGGGEMIHKVTFEKTEYAPPPNRFEAGTLHIAGAIAWATAIDYLQKIGIDKIAKYEDALLDYATEKALQFPGLKIYGTAKNKASILSFTIENIHAHDLGTICDQSGVGIRTGHHCAMPVMQHYDVAATARASFMFYNTFTEIDQLFAALTDAREIFGL
jgi:cysteine desulfurase/selenocysteine lyase